MAETNELALLAVELFVPDVPAAVAHYRDLLGFAVVREDPGFAVVALGQAIIMLAHEALRPDTAATPPQHRGAAIDVRIMVPDVDAVYRALREKGVRIDHDIGDREYGLRDFIIRDLNGFRLRFAAPLR
jgi:catechol 2,3-dioxygenase-like lactoylglutathione lyase family enzyme